MLDPSKELARLRKEKGLTIKELAKLAETTPDYIWALEHGKLPGIEVASKLASVLVVPLDVFWIKYKQKQPIDVKEVEGREKTSRRLADSPGIEILNLSPRSFNALYGADIETVGELLQLTDKDLSKIRNLGPASIIEVKEKLAKYSPPRTDSARKIDTIDGLNSVDN